MNYYNENDPHAAAWLKALMAEGHIPKGIVDDRSIHEVSASDLAGFTQCHFFAGIGGWSLALRLAGWPEDRAVWTGSCPCQPFSAAGKRRGTKDKRHLWPVWFPLIRECRPPVIFGEQVASKDALRWFDGVLSDLEGTRYAAAAADLCAASVGAPHIRQRLCWVAYAEGVGWGTGPMLCPDNQAGNTWPGNGSYLGGLADTDGRNSSAERQQCGGEQRLVAQNDHVGGLADTSHPKRRTISVAGQNERDGQDDRRTETYGQSGACDPIRRMEHSEGDGRQQGRAESNGGGAAGGCGDSRLENTDGEGSAGESYRLLGPGDQNHWSDFDFLLCTDGKARRVEPGTFPLAHGVPGRVGRLRGYGNAIVPQVAAEFIKALIA